ncbi:MAG: hypothetical protein ACSLEY_01385 [Candidatus Saccharimonadales bacterium]
MNSQIFFYSDAAKDAVQSVIQSLPDGVEVYLVGGAIRNALVKKYHDETWVQRDYDQAITSGSSQYLAQLEQLGFSQGGISNIEHIVMVKPLKADGQVGSYEDNIVFDMHTVDGTTIEDNLKYSTALSINGFALPLRNIFDEDWEDKLIQLPGALESIKNKQINLNQEGYTSESNYFFALLRFMGAGFAAPRHDDVIKLLKVTADIEPDRYARNVTKLVNYVGGEDRVREIVNSLGIENLDIFDEQSTKQLARSS